MDADDQELSRRLAAGDRAALAALYDRHGALCYRAALGACGSSMLAEDAVQEVFMRIARDPSRPAAAGNLAGYLLRMAQHAACDLARRAGRRQQALDPAWVTASGGGDAERDHQVATALAALSPEQRDVVQLRVWEERSLEEIGAILGISPNTVSSRWRYALARLAQLLKGSHDA